MTDLPISIGLEVLQHFEELGVEYMLVGSVASSLQGIARSTLDIDILAKLQPAQAVALVNRLQDDFYISPVAVQEALRRRSMFNIIQFSSGFKIDVYVLGNKPFDQEEFRRRQSFLREGIALWVATPEDLILSKLDWYRLGGETSERQWRDVLGLLQVHNGQLDLAYVQHWASQLRLGELWVRALTELGKINNLGGRKEG